jgi:hypothetical protein
MTMETVQLNVPEIVYQRMKSTAKATHRSIEDIMVYALRVGSPPTWDDVPPEFQADLAAMDRMEDDALWVFARARKTLDEMARYDELLARHQDGLLTDSEKQELTQLRMEADRFMLRKAHAAALLRWRGHTVPRN